MKESNATVDSTLKELLEISSHTQQSVDQLRAPCLAQPRVLGAGAPQRIQHLRNLRRCGRRKCPAAACLQDFLIECAGIQAVEQQPGKLQSVRGGIAVWLTAVKQHNLSGAGDGRRTVQRQFHCAIMHKKQHDILVVVTLQGNFRPMIEGIPAAAEVMSEPRWVIKKLLCKRRRRKKVPFRGLMDT